MAAKRLEDERGRARLVSAAELVEANEGKVTQTAPRMLQAR